MRKSIVAAILPLVIVGLVIFFYAQKDEDNRNDTDTVMTTVGCEDVDTIKVKAKASDLEDNLDTYLVTAKDILGKSSEGGLQTNYALQGRNQVIKQTFYSETGKSEVEYYLDEGRVFYFTKKNSTYELPISVDPRADVKHLELNEFYLGSDQTLCLWYSDQVQQENTQPARDTVMFLLSDLQ